jgi:hypothetical protein
VVEAGSTSLLTELLYGRIYASHATHGGVILTAGKRASRFQRKDRYGNLRGHNGLLRKRYESDYKRRR